jgi:hypothetical protein
MSELIDFFVGLFDSLLSDLHSLSNLLDRLLVYRELTNDKDCNSSYSLWLSTSCDLQISDIVCNINSSCVNILS